MIYSNHIKAIGFDIAWTLGRNWAIEISKSDTSLKDCPFKGCGHYNKRLILFFFEVAVATESALSLRIRKHLRKKRHFIVSQESPDELGSADVRHAIETMYDQQQKSGQTRP